MKIRLFILRKKFNFLTERCLPESRMMVKVNESRCKQSGGNSMCFHRATSIEKDFEKR